ncbi:hypothetical protein IQ260_06260 [Leptolyngbya cf. ectocarpi LEGE 11479]|uniref:Uncharacterized protein n=1 Tax=Leptolyngbya cf. ectocarpi LEGE 11479 TaxID=1828722 RepID=A0A928ZT26_LEPEC|nr:hypothetical protein [Leptolyngbya ectocarpi]MBE9066251.1 hypothetical protein [Leptolyngbya cf. ectocarpi LEGE 11479]
MPRLSARAYSLLDAELKRLCAGKPTEKIRRDIVAKRLQKMCDQEGSPATYAELKDAVDDIFPEFDEQVLKRAAKLNLPNPVIRPTKWLLAIAAGTVTLAGGLWFVNLPYPMIRWPMARVAPMLLLPSFMRMDHSYRQAIIYTEQADQLINNATSVADFELGEEKSAQAQTYLDRLPVWFLGYYPQRYCRFFGCGWRFTLDEFEEARALIGRMEAQIFQEQNAFEQLDAGTSAVETAKRQYPTAQTSADKTATLVAWQAGMDQLNEIPKETLAGAQAQTRLEAFQRDYSNLAGSTADVQQSTDLITVAKNYGIRAAEIVQGAPHPVDTWARAENLWKEAIDALNKVPAGSPGFVEAEKIKAEYIDNKEQIATRKRQEQKAIATFEAVQADVIELIDKSERGEIRGLKAQFQRVIQQLGTVPENTTVSEEVQLLQKQAQAKLNELQQVLN